MLRHTNSRLLILAGGTGANLSHTWFAVQNGTKFQAPMAGSRRGYPNADLLFSFIMAKILRRVSHRALEADVALEEQTEFRKLIHNAAWVDDAAFAVFAPASQLVQKTATLLAIIVGAMAEHGRKLSFGPGKTAILFEFHGAESALKTHQRQQNACWKTWIGHAMFRTLLLMLHMPTMSAGNSFQAKLLLPLINRKSMAAGLLWDMLWLMTFAVLVAGSIIPDQGWFITFIMDKHHVGSGTWESLSQWQRSRRNRWMTGIVNKVLLCINKGLFSLKWTKHGPSAATLNEFQRYSAK